MNKDTFAVDPERTRVDIRHAHPLAMEEGLPAKVPFLPHRLMTNDHHRLVIGTEGELLLLDSDLQATGQVVVPFPMRISHAALQDNRLYATWIDGELMKARMGAIDLSKPLQNGVNRAVLRTHQDGQHPLHPEGAIWSHVLDAEPLGLSVLNDDLVFVLWRRGIYGLTPDARERWRRPEAAWSYPKARPRGTETIALHMETSTFTITSRGGRVQRRSQDNGETLEEFIAPGPEAPLEHHFREGDHHLYVSTNGGMHWVHDDTVLANVQSSGPVQSAIWDHQWNGWRVAGWREELLLSPQQVARHPWEEIPVALIPVKNGALILFNDGSWANSAFEHSNHEEE